MYLKVFLASVVVLPSLLSAQVAKADYLDGINAVLGRMERQLDTMPVVPSSSSSSVSRVLNQSIDHLDNLARSVGTGNAAEIQRAARSNVRYTPETCQQLTYIVARARQLAPAYDRAGNVNAGNYFRSMSAEASTHLYLGCNTMRF